MFSDFCLLNKTVQAVGKMTSAATIWLLPLIRSAEGENDLVIDEYICTSI